MKAWFLLVRRDLRLGVRQSGDAALVTCPKDELVKLPFTELAPSNCLWLNALKVSSRNSTDLTP